jgi:hypothetical protein
VNCDPAQVSCGVLHLSSCILRSAWRKGMTDCVAVQAWYEAADEVREAKTWFWRFTRQRPVVLEKLANERAAYAIVREHDRHLESLISAARAELGLWSELGVGEGRQLFWRSFQAGKVTSSCI